MDLIRAPPQSVPELALNGAWQGIESCSFGGRLAVAKHALESGIMDLCASCMNQFGSASEWLSISNGQGGRAALCFDAAGVMRTYGGEQERPDKATYLEACLVCVSPACSRSSSEGMLRLLRTPTTTY